MDLLNAKINGGLAFAEDALGPVNIWPVEQFFKDYQMLDKLGEGQFGEVYKVCRLKSDQIFAAKFTRCSKASDKLRVRQEIDILKLFDHKNVLKLAGAHEDDNIFIQVLEYLPGGQVFNRIINSDFEITEDDISFIILQVCDACRHIASFSVVHLDLKPENIVCAEPQGFVIKLVDFGFAKQLTPDSGPVLASEGTPEFASPEVVKREPVTLSTDLWSVGVMTYVLLSGLSPFKGETIDDTFDNILDLNYSFDEPEFEVVTDMAKDFIGHLLVLDPDCRYTAEEALWHPWLVAETLKSKKLKRKTSYNRRKLTSFTNLAQTRWQKCAKVINACKTLKQTTNM